MLGAMEGFKFTNFFKEWIKHSLECSSENGKTLLAAPLEQTELQRW